MSGSVLSFHGGAGTVTGSRHLLSLSRRRLLVDAGLFQGLKKLRLLNWQEPDFDPHRSIICSSPRRTSITAATFPDSYARDTPILFIALRRLWIW